MDTVARPPSLKKKGGKPAARGAGKAPALKVAPIQTLAQEAAEARSRQLLAALMAFAGGDFGVRLPSDWSGVDARIAEAFNQSIGNADRITAEAARLSNTVGKEGRLTQRISAPGAVGSWAAQVDSFNTLIDDLVRPTADIARTIGAVAKGDLAQPVELQVDGRPLKGEFLRSAKLVNSMIEQLSVFTSEVTRVAREVARGQAGRPGKVKGVSASGGLPIGQRWPATSPAVRNIADVTIAWPTATVKKITVDVRGEILREGSPTHGGPAALLRLRGHAGGARGGTDGAWAARRWCRAWPAPGRTDRLRELHARPDGAVRNIARWPPHRARRLSRRSRWTCAARSWSEGDHQHDGRPAQRLLLGGEGWRARSDRGKLGGQGSAGHRRPGRTDRLGQLHGLQPTGQFANRRVATASQGRLSRKITWK